MVPVTLLKGWPLDWRPRSMAWIGVRLTLRASAASTCVRPAALRASAKALPSRSQSEAFQSRSRSMGTHDAPVLCNHVARFRPFDLRLGSQIELLGCMGAHRAYWQVGGAPVA